MNIKIGLIFSSWQELRLRTELPQNKQTCNLIVALIYGQLVYENKLYSDILRPHWCNITSGMFCKCVLRGAVHDCVGQKIPTVNYPN